MGDFQIGEILLTAAQSLLALFMIVNLRFSIRYGMVLFVLFVGQIVSPSLVELLPGKTFMGLHGPQMHNVFSLLYVGGAIILLIEHPNRWRALFQLELPAVRHNCPVAAEFGCHEYPNCINCGKDGIVNAED
jgi:cation:H+ antiporter